MKFVCEGLELRRVNVDLYFRACGHIESFLNPSDPPHQATNVFYAEALSLLLDILRRRYLWPGEPVGLNFQNRNGKIERYQADQLVEMINRHEDEL